MWLPAFAAGFFDWTYMPNDLAEQILGKFEQTAELYHRLILLVGLPGRGKTSALVAVAAAPRPAVAKA